MSVEVSTDVQITKYKGNSREPIVVETKTTTTTTTTTVTKRICLPKDTNYDVAEIQTLLNGDNTAATDLSKILPPNSDITSTKSINTKNNDTVISTELRKNPVDLDNTQSLLSSTKIENLTESPISHKCDEKTLTDSPQSDFLSPKLLTISNTESPLKDNNKNAKKSIKSKNSKTLAKSKSNGPSKKKMAKEKSQPAENEKRTTRSTTLENEKYIDSLINKYIKLETKPVKRVKSQKQPKAQKQPPQLPSVSELKDLSAIFENSAEGFESPLAEQPSDTLNISFNNENNTEQYIQPADFPSPIQTNSTNEFILPAKEPLKQINNNRNKKRTITNDKLEPSNIKKRQKTTKSIQKIHKTIMKPSENDTNFSNCTIGSNSPITIYSPSTRGKIGRNAPNKITLTKKMIERKLESHQNSSKCILKRFNRSKAITVDANSRLILYNPNGEETEESNISAINDEIDILSVIVQKKKPFLVKEIKG